MTQTAQISSKSDLEKEVFHLRKQLEKQTNKVLELETTVSKLTDYLRLSQQARFGRKSEKVSDDDDNPMLLVKFLMKLPLKLSLRSRLKSAVLKAAANLFLKIFLVKKSTMIGSVNNWVGVEFFTDLVAGITTTKQPDF